MNSVHLSGRLTRDPELRHTTAGVPVAAFTLAVDRKFERDKADFINVTAWRKTAEFVSRYFKKGQRVTVAEGRIRVDQYTDKDGNKRTRVEVVADAVEFADGRCDQDGGPAGSAAARYAEQHFEEMEDEGDDDLPWKD